ncbi:hypothetical protein LRN56_15405, partial [Staphylococcus aureus]|nr:hypothetical protein [Staphylococcus aureus]
TQNWLNYAFEGEQWLAKQAIIPNFLTLKLLVNLIQLYDSGKHIGFNSEVYAKVGQLYDDFYRQELTKRNQVRKLKVKEVMIDEKLVNEAD